MTATNTIGFEKIYIAIETAYGSGVYTTPCVFINKKMKHSTDMITDTVPQCDAPTSPATKSKFIDTIDYQFSGDGKLERTALRFWREWHRDGRARGVRIYNDQSHALDGGYDSGQGILSDFEYDAERGKKVSFSCTIDIDGALTWTDNA